MVDTVGVTRFFANVTPRVTRRRRRQGAMPLFTKTYEYRHPKGLVGFISPWNYPFNLGISDAIGALATGNAVLVKPDEKTPFSALFGARLLEEAGVPRDLVQILSGSGAPIGQAIVSEVDYIMFTGVDRGGAADRRDGGSPIDRLLHGARGQERRRRPARRRHRANRA